MIFVCYPKCSTCMRAKKHLNQLGLAFEEQGYFPGKSDRGRTGTVDRAQRSARKEILQIRPAGCISRCS